MLALFCLANMAGSSGLAPAQQRSFTVVDRSGSSSTSSMLLDFREGPAAAAHAPPPMGASTIIGGRLHVDGSPFFPLGMYTHALEDLDWAWMKASGQNTVLTYTNGQKSTIHRASEVDLKTIGHFLDSAETHGIKVFLSFKDLYDAHNKGADNVKIVSTIVTAFRAHKALLGYYVNDEYKSDYLPMLEKRAQLLAALDPYHVLYSVEACWTAQLCNTTRLRAYRNTSTLFGTDPYPWLNRTLTLDIQKEASEIDNLIAAWPGDDGVAYCTVFQIFSQGPFECAKDPAHCKDRTWPPYEVMRAMAFLQPVLGSGGLLQYAYYAQFGYPGKMLPRTDPAVAARLSVLAKLGLELRAFADREFLGVRTVLEVTGGPTTPGGRQATQWAALFHCDKCSTGGTLVVVNGNSKAATVQVHGLAKKKSVTLDAWGVVTERLEDTSAHAQAGHLKSDDDDTASTYTYRGRGFRLHASGLRPARPPVVLPDAPPWPHLAATPVMGYNGWLAATMSHQAGATNQSIYYKIADKLIESGLAAAGYDTVLVVCNGFHRDPVTAKLQVNPNTWPDGFEAFVDYAHAKSPPLKVGAYTDTGTINCCPGIDYPGHRHGPGSFGHEELDVQQFVDWGVDHIAVDNCGNPDGGDQSIFEYAAFHDALVKVNRPVVFGIWAVGLGKPWAWANKLGHYWRTAGDLGNRWGQDTAQAGDAGVMYNYGIQQAIPSIAEISGPGSFAFLDELMVGQVPGIPHGAGDVGLTLDEARTHFAIWCMMTSPMWLTHNIFDPPPGIHELITNADAIAISQDPLGKMAVRIDGSSHSGTGLRPRPATCGLEANWPNGEQLARPLANGDWAVLLFNRRLNTSMSITLDLKDIGDTSVSCFNIRDVWSQSDLGVHARYFEAADVPPHANRFLRLSKVENSSACPPPPPPGGGSPPLLPPCPPGFTPNKQRGFWLNTNPCPGNASNPMDPNRWKCKEDLGVSVEGCAKKCNDSRDCVAFELYAPGKVGGCFTFHKTLGPPFQEMPESLTCLKNEADLAVHVKTDDDTYQYAAQSSPFPLGFSVADGGGAVLKGFTELRSTFAGRYTLTTTSSRQHGWSSVTVDRSGAITKSVISVRAVTPTFTLNRRYIASEDMCGSTGAACKVYINDTLTCTVGGGARCALHTQHTYTLLAASNVTLNGGYYAPQLGECQTALQLGTQGNPSAVVARTGGGGFGVMALDDVSRAHVSMVNRASPTRVPGFKPCEVSDPPTLDVLDTYLALSSGQQYTAEWSLYPFDATLAPEEVLWTFTNRLRSDLGVDKVTLKGGATLASWQVNILNASNWTYPGCNCTLGTPGCRHGQMDVCWPAFSDRTLAEFLEYQGTELVVANIMRMNQSWPRCEDNSSRDYCYGSCSTAHQESKRSDEYMHKLVGSLKRIRYKGKALLYLHPFISTETGAAQKYKADRQLKADGSQVCDYAGEYVGTLTNQYGNELLKFVELAMDTYQFDGIYLDESAYGQTPLDFSSARSDSHSAIIDPKTFEISGHVSFVPLTWGELQAVIYDEVVGRRGGTMITNYMPITRTVMHAAIRNNVLSFVESSNKGREFSGHAYTPLALSKALFQQHDYDPKYMNIGGDPVDNLWADLDFATLTYMYDILLPNVSGWTNFENVMQHIFPTTPIELGPGFIVGRERIVTKVSRSFTRTESELTLRVFDRQGFLTNKSTVKGPEVQVNLDGGGARSFAVVSAE